MWEIDSCFWRVADAIPGNFGAWVQIGIRRRFPSRDVGASCSLRFCLITKIRLSPGMEMATSLFSYSPRDKAATGSIFAAFRAGIKPKLIPIRVELMSAANIVFIECTILKSEL